VDHPYTQSRKVQLLTNALSTAKRYKSKGDVVGLIDMLSTGLERVQFVPVDFEQSSLAEALVSDSGPNSRRDKSKRYNPNDRSLFIWEAVSQYLTPEAVDQVLHFVHQHSALGSLIAFDYKYLEAIQGKTGYFGTNMSQFVSSVGASNRRQVELFLTQEIRRTLHLWDQ